MYRYVAILLILSLVAIYACDSGLSGELNENQPPTTSLTVNEINLDGEDQRLVSQVNISWWGDDPDGYVVGFEFYIGEGFETAPDEEWTFTTSTDSTFILPIEEGKQEDDVRFTVRAVDNDDARDPNPPSIVFPITNSPPNVSFNSLETPPDTTYRIASFGFQASDPDGEANLNRVEIALNDTTSEDAWNDIGLGLDLVTIRIDDSLNEPEASVYLGRSASASDIIFDTVNIDGDNEFFIRAIDNAGAISEVASYTWYVKKQLSRILFLNDFESNTEARGEMHLNLLDQLGFSVIDILDISDFTAPSAGRVQLSQAFPDRSLATPTTNMMLAEWDHIYWISDNLFRNIGYALEMTIDFFDRGGTMFVNIPTRFASSDTPVVQFLPFERMEPRPTNNRRFEIPGGSALSASANIDNPPGVFFRNLVHSTPPIVPFSESIPLFEAQFEIFDPVTGTRTEFDGSHLVSATDPDENLIYFGINFNNFSQPGNSNCVPIDQAEEGDLPCSELEDLLSIMIIDILGFQE